jgi:outer membrane protein OmpA-like peptidoglycan-associated protein
LAPVRPDPARRRGAAFDDVDEADHPLRHGRSRGVKEALVAKAAKATLLGTAGLGAGTPVAPKDVRRITGELAVLAQRAAARPLASSARAAAGSRCPDCSMGHSPF